MASVIAIKNFVMQGKEYKAGDTVDVSSLPASKVSQLLDQRWIRPVEK